MNRFVNAAVYIGALVFWIIAVRAMGVPEQHRFPVALVAALATFYVYVAVWVVMKLRQFGAKWAARGVMKVVGPEVGFSAVFSGALIGLHYANAPQWAWGLVVGGVFLFNYWRSKREASR